MDNSIFNKTIIYIDSKNCVYTDSTKSDFYVDIIEPLKNVAYIKLIKSVVVIKPKSNLNGNLIQDYDPIYIKMNDYNRISSVINGNVGKYFDVININLTEVYGIINEVLLAVTEVAFSNDYSHSEFDEDDISVHTLYPPQDSLKRFNIQIYDKNNNIIPKNEIITFKMTLCVYTLKLSKTIMSKNI
jgi:hypothetical protein